MLLNEYSRSFRTAMVPPDAICGTYGRLGSLSGSPVAMVTWYIFPHNHPSAISLLGTARHCLGRFVWNEELWMMTLAFRAFCNLLLVSCISPDCGVRVPTLQAHRSPIPVPLCCWRPPSPAISSHFSQPCCRSGCLFGLYFFRTRLRASLSDLSPCKRNRSTSLSLTAFTNAWAASL
jgi:hypothetical protein